MSGRSNAGRMHLRATCDKSVRTLCGSTLVFLQELHIKALDKQLSSAKNLTQSIKSMTPDSKEVMSRELLRVKSSKKITQNAYTSLFNDGHCLQVNSGGINSQER